MPGVVALLPRRHTRGERMNKPLIAAWVSAVIGLGAMRLLM